MTRLAAKRKRVPEAGRVDRRVARLEAAVLGPAGRSDARLRRAVFEWASRAPGGDEARPSADELPAALQPLVEKVVRHAYRVTDEDVAAARAAGHSEDELFDVIVAAALGAGLARRERGMAAIAAWEQAR